MGLLERCLVVVVAHSVPMEAVAEAHQLVMIGRQMHSSPPGLQLTLLHS